MVGIDDHVDTPAGQLILSKLVVGGRNSHDGCMGIFLAEFLSELLYVHAVFVLGVYHDAVCTRFDVSLGPFKGILYRLACYE